MVPTRTCQEPHLRLDLISEAETPLRSELELGSSDEILRGRSGVLGGRHEETGPDITINRRDYGPDTRRGTMTTCQWNNSFDLDGDAESGQRSVLRDGFAAYRSEVLLGGL